MDKKPIVKIWHPWYKWECFKAGFFGPFPDGMNKTKGEQLFKEFFITNNLFADSLEKVLKEWTFSTEHNLTSATLNKIAWSGQAACCYAWGIPADCRSGYRLLTLAQQKEADEIARRLLINWYEEQGYECFEKL